jgi:hypothetical protein
MPNLHHHFCALLANVNPQPEREALAARLPGQVREWLTEHDFETAWPHTRLSGSYPRDTAICDIKDVDVLLFVPESQLDRTPNALLLELKRTLDEYPDATAEASGQRRSVHLEFPDYALHLDIVPAVAPDGIEKPLRVPDRPQQRWIDSDPLGYAARLSELNQEHGEKLKPLIKLIKAWRDVQMEIRRPKSYVLEVIVMRAVEAGDVELCGRSAAQNLADFFAHITGKYAKLMDEGSEAPRIADPQVGSYITAGWSREHFETFMRRAREADRAAARAISADSVDGAIAEWQTIFGYLWPTADLVKMAARREAANVQPGVTRIASSGLVVGPVATRTIQTLATTYHGG